MKKIKLIFFYNLLLILFFKNILAKVETNIVIKIENEIITNYEIKNKILTTLFLSNEEINQKNINQLKKQAVNFLIQHKLRIIELNKYNIKNDETRVNTYLNSVSSNNIIGLKEKFKKNNINFELYKDEIITEFKWQKLIYSIYSNKITIDENNIDKELNEIIKKKTDIEQFRLSEIEILLNNNIKDNENILLIKKQIEEQGFENAALKFSISSTSSKQGDLGWLNAKSISKEIYNIISKMKVGDVTDPIKRQNNILFLKLKDKKILKSKDANIVELKKNLIANKKNELFNLYSKSHLSKLKNTSLIEYR